MKKAILFALALCFLLGCSKSPATLELSDDACISPLEWGMTADEARTALSGYELTEEIGEGEASLSFDAPLFGQDVSINLKLALFSSGKDLYVPLEQSEPVLWQIQVLAKDKDALRESVSAVLGEQQTRQIGYYDYDGEIGIKEGDELNEEQRYWRSEQTIADLFDEKELEPIASEQVFEKSTDEIRFYDKRAYVVSWAFTENDKVALIFTGSLLALRHILNGE
ncbi:MAG: hypothetical protein GX811_09450 [Lentisphaerae bacterium]|nr:hypothetical protein [Lentisphaerota bacterium]NLV50407.1 hypothetical protein [Clostridiales bacterium]